MYIFNPMSLLSCSLCSLNPTSWGTALAALLSSRASTWALAVSGSGTRKAGQAGWMCFWGLGYFCFITLKSLQLNINLSVFNLAVLLPDLLSCLQLTGCHKEVTGQWQFVCHGPLLFQLDFYLVMNQATGVQSGKKKVSQGSKLKLESFSVH